MDLKKSLVKTRNCILTYLKNRWGEKHEYSVTINEGIL